MAAMNTVQAALDCAVCMERYRDPRVLSCGHSFCLQCLERITVNPGGLPCPNCRSLTPLTTEGRQGLPKPYALMDVLEALEGLRLEPGIPEPPPPYPGTVPETPPPNPGIVPEPPPPNPAWGTEPRTPNPNWDTEPLALYPERVPEPPPPNPNWDTEPQPPYPAMDLDSRSPSFSPVIPRIHSPHTDSVEDESFVCGGMRRSWHSVSSDAIHAIYSSYYPRLQSESSSLLSPTHTSTHRARIPSAPSHSLNDLTSPDTTREPSAPPVECSYFPWPPVCGGKSFSGQSTLKPAGSPSSYRREVKPDTVSLYQGVLYGNVLLYFI